MRNASPVFRLSATEIRALIAIAVLGAFSPAYCQPVTLKQAEEQMEAYVLREVTDPKLRDMWRRLGKKEIELRTDAVGVSVDLELRPHWQKFWKSPQDPAEYQYIVNKARETLAKTPLDWKELRCALHATRLGFSGPELWACAADTVDRYKLLDPTIAPRVEGAIEATGDALWILARSGDDAYQKTVEQAVNLSFWGIQSHVGKQPKLEAPEVHYLRGYALNALRDMEDAKAAYKIFKRLAKSYPVTVTTSTPERPMTSDESIAVRIQYEVHKFKTLLDATASRSG